MVPVNISCHIKVEKRLSIKDERLALGVSSKFGPTFYSLPFSNTMSQTSSLVHHVTTEDHLHSAPSQKGLREADHIQRAPPTVPTRQVLPVPAAGYAQAGTLEAQQRKGCQGERFTKPFGIQALTGLQSSQVLPRYRWEN